MRYITALIHQQYPMIQHIVFVTLTVAAFGLAFVQFRRIRRNIGLGKAEHIGGRTAERWKNVALIAFGQKKMFKQWLPATLHLFIYAAFLLTQIELIEILIDGFTGHHRVFAPLLGGFYTFLINVIEVLSLLTLIATLFFLSRRTFLKSLRFQKAEMQGWPSTDGILILAGEIFLVVGIFSMNAADGLLQVVDPEHYPDTGHLVLSSVLGSTLLSNAAPSTLVFIERTGWWIHLITVYAFLNYLPISKHLHIILAFPNAYFSRLRPRGEMENMPDIMHEVKSMMGLEEEQEAPPTDLDTLPEFGARDIFGLTWKTLLDAYTCTECGRCTDVCPANITGKKLSPRKVMMDIRDRMETVSQKMTSDTKEPFDDGVTLFDTITPEELHACTACQACVEACPVMINPLDPILAMRRYEILTESTGPTEWIPMFNSIENNGAVWQVTEPRDAWTRSK